MANGEINATDLTEETTSTLSGNEQFVMFDPVEGKRADIDAVATYITGDKSQLTTTNKTSPVAAINELKSGEDDLKEDITDINNALPNKANVDGAYEGMTVGNAEQIVSSQRLTDKAPYLFRTSGGGLEIGDREYVKLVGASAVVNQLVRPFEATYWTAHNTATSLSFSNNEVSFVTAATNDGIKLSSSSYYPNAIKGHTYLAVVSLKADVATQMRARPFAGIGEIVINVTSSWQTASRVFICEGDTQNINVYIQDIGTVNHGKCYAKDYNIIDLTAYFGVSAIADRAYTLEQSQAGSGIAWLKSYGFFTKSYYPYNAGTLQSTKTSKHINTGFNQWDEEWEQGTINNSTGANQANSNYFRSKNYIRVIPSTTYHFKTSGDSLYRFWYDANQNYIGYTSGVSDTDSVVGDNAYYMRFVDVTRNAYDKNSKPICINRSDPSRNGEYEPYVAHEYDMPDTELMGVYDLDQNNNIYAKGNVQHHEGTTDLKYEKVGLSSLSWNYDGSRFYALLSGSVHTGQTSINAICSKYIWSNSYYQESGDKRFFISTGNYLSIWDSSYTDLATFEAAISDVYLIYELATPTTETTDPFQSPQVVDPYGTEEFVDGRTVELPVGHETEYPANLKDKLEAAPNSPSVDGLYLMKRENGENTYTQYVDPVPARPSTDGTYVLKATVSGGTATLSWVAE